MGRAETSGSRGESVLAVDVGGTFTDAALIHNGRLYAAKALTTRPQDDGVLEAIDAVLARAGCGAHEVARFAHGTTTATNALLERAGVRVAAVVSEDARGLLELGRQQRPSLYHLENSPTRPPIAYAVAVGGRMGVDGELRPVPDESIERCLSELRSRGGEIDAVAVCLLHSWRDAAHERLIAEHVRNRFPGMHVVASHELTRELREYERASTTVLDAYLTPVLAPYLERLVARCAERSFPAPLVMQSDGGLDDAADVAQHAARAVLSGPAGGLVAAATMSAAVDGQTVLCIDVGGTSCDVAVVGGRQIERSSLRTIDGLPIQLPIADIHTIGAGGSSIAWRDEGGALQVGPSSAGSIPGPACYGRGGTTATVTDAHLQLGHLHVDVMRQWGMTLDDRAAQQALAALADDGESPTDVAAQIVSIVTANMSEAARTVSVARGHDPSEIAVMGFGGAGALHACDIADALGCDTVLAPLHAGVLSACGLAVAARRKTTVRSVAVQVPAETGADALRMASRVIADDLRELRSALEHVDGATHYELALDMRYMGQSHTLPIVEQLAASDERDVEGAIVHAARTFQVEHRNRYGYTLDAGVELVTARSSIVVPASATLADAQATAVVPAARAITQHNGRRAQAIDLEQGTLLIPEGWDIDAALPSAMVIRRATDPADSVDVRHVERLPLAARQRQLDGIAEEMGAVLVRAAISANIKEREDSSCALYDAHGRLLAQAAHIPVHLGSMGHSVDAVRRSARPGDVWMLNDPFAGGTHLPDITLISCIGTSDDVIGYAACRAHHADIGGDQPGSMFAHATTIDEEGVRIAPTRVGTGGHFSSDAVDPFVDRMRQPHERRADIAAQHAALLVADRRLRALVDNLGTSGWLALCDEVIDYGRRRCSTVLEQHDGATGVGERVVELPDGSDARVRVTVSVQDASLLVDFAGTDSATPTSLNCPLSVTHAAVMFAVRVAVDPDLPNSGGVDQLVTVRAESGTLVNAQSPAAVAAGNVEVSSVIVDAVMAALGKFLDVPADGQGTMNNVVLGNQRFSYYETLAGGQGASRHSNGPDAVHVAMTNTRNTPIEMLELEYPIRVTRYDVRRGSGGAGAHRGGDGIVRRFAVLESCTANIIAQRRRHAPQGLLGGEPGALGEQFVNGEPVPGLASIALDAGDELEIHTPGGGGFGRRD